MNDTLDGLQQFDEDLDAPFMKQQVLASAVRRRSPISTPSSGLETPQPQPGANPNAPMQAGDYRDRAFALLKQASESTPDQTDVNALREYAKTREENANRQLLAGLALSMKGGETFQPLGEHMLRNALATNAPEKFGGGLLAGGQFIADPEANAQRRAVRLETQARLYEAMASHADTVEQRRAAAEAAAALRRDLAQNKSARLQRAGMTPSGETVSFDPSSGDTLVAGKPYSGPVMSQATLDKQAQTVSEAITSVNRLQGLDQLVAKYPNAFGGVASLSQLTPQVIASRWQAAKLTPEERQARALVMTEAANVIHELYGSALTAGEAARANTFAPTGLDDPATVAVKLQAAQRWAASKAGQYGQQVRGAAESRMGGAQRSAPSTSSSRGGPPAGAVERLD